MIKRFHAFILAFIALFVMAAAPLPAFAAECGGTKTGLVDCKTKDPGVGTINDLISLVVTIMTTVIGIVAVGGLVYAAILYASARDDQSQTGQAMTIIRNIIIGLILYGFTIAIINWLIPGGVIG